MKYSEKLHLSNGYFCIEVPQYDTHLSEEISAEGEIVHNLKLKRKDDKKKYEFTDKTGLSFQEREDVIGKVISLDTQNDTAIKKLIETYGYLFNIECDTYTLININNLRKALDYFKAFYELTNSIERKDKNYTEIVNYICKLLWVDPNIQMDGYYVHPFMEFWEPRIPVEKENIDNIEDVLGLPKIMSINSYEEKPAYGVSYTVPSSTEFNNQIYYYDDICTLLYDTYIDKEIEFSIDYTKEYETMKYDETMSFREKANATHFNVKLYNLYISETLNKDISTSKKAIDMFFHLNNECTEDNCQFKYDPDKYSVQLISSITPNEKEKEKILLVAKSIIKDIYDTILSNVHPIYNLTNGLQDWYLPSMYCALYFANFLRNHEQFAYRVCANPRCSEVFWTGINNSVKIYCTRYCQNANAQYVSRHKKIQV